MPAGVISVEAGVADLDRAGPWLQQNRGRCGSAAGAGAGPRRSVLSDGQLVGASRRRARGIRAPAAPERDGDEPARAPRHLTPSRRVDRQTATGMGGLASHDPAADPSPAAAIGVQRDFGLGAVCRRAPALIDLVVGARPQRLGSPTSTRLWSWLCGSQRPPGSGAASRRARPRWAMGRPARPRPRGGRSLQRLDAGVATGVPLTAGERAGPLPDGSAAAPRARRWWSRRSSPPAPSPASPYLYGGGHGLPPREIEPAYDCSSSVEHLSTERGWPR